MLVICLYKPFPPNVINQNSPNLPCQGVRYSNGNPPTLSVGSVTVQITPVFMSSKVIQEFSRQWLLLSFLSWVFKNGIHWKKIKFIKFEVTFFGFLKIGNPIKKWKFHGVVQYTYGCSGKRNGQVSWRTPIKNCLGSLVKVCRLNYCSSAGRFSDVAEKQ